MCHPERAKRVEGSKSRSCSGLRSETNASSRASEAELGIQVVLLGSGREGRDFDDHSQSAAILAGRREDASAMQLNDAAAYREAKTAASIVRAGVTEADETFKDARTLLSA